MVREQKKSNRTFFGRIAVGFAAIGKDLRKNYALYLMAAPAVAALLIFSYAPMMGLVMAFQNLDLRLGIFKSPWVGLRNFEFLFTTSDAFRIMRNTLAYNSVFIVLGTFFAVLLAVLLSEISFKGMAKAFQTIYIMPNFLSMPVVAIIVSAFLSLDNGFLNRILAFFGYPAVNWYMEREPWPFILTITHLWKSVGYSSVVYLAAISGISQEYYEAAALDGANRFEQVIHITLPHLRPMISILLIMSIGNIFRGDFGLFYTVTQNNGRLYPVTDVMDTYIYRAMTSLNNVGMATAAGLYQSVVCFLCVLFANWVVKKIEPDNSMF